jgi:tetrahydromethanopterin S-methyltransferase subunit F
MQPESSHKLKGRLMSMANTPSPDRVKTEVEDILSILKMVGKK